MSPGRSTSQMSGRRPACYCRKTCVYDGVDKVCVVACGSVVASWGRALALQVTCYLWFISARQKVPSVALAVVPVKCGSDMAVQFDATGSLDVQ
jgi:hypothetical protein